jgi:hypothetical protein
MKKTNQGNSIHIENTATSPGFRSSLMLALVRLERGTGEEAKSETCGYRLKLRHSDGCIKDVKYTRETLHRQ